ncbi:hypothetical protein [Vibrio crassostreae]|uniref:hypothetical protein n=1 Tax=Vibrio crassostreae TaxID=246167 RepID=UPI001B30DD27|nr:hypothetical protein [Vibrio crassostreae]
MKDKFLDTPMACPTCGGDVHCERETTDSAVYKLGKGGSLKNIGESSNSDYDIYCSKDREHDLPDGLRNSVIEFVDDNEPL